MSMTDGDASVSFTYGADLRFIQAMSRPCNPDLYSRLDPQTAGDPQPDASGEAEGGG
jgi:hypothetical protein